MPEMVLRRCGWPLGPLPLLAVLAGSAALTALANRPGDDYGLWVTTSAAVHESVGLVAIVVAFVAAWTGREVARRDVVFHGAGVAARGRQLTALTLVLSACALLGILVAMVPLLVWTGRTATWGSFDPLALVTTVAGVVSVVAVPVVLGALTERIAWSFVIAVGTTVVLWLPSIIDRAFAVVTPVWDWVAGPRFSANPAIVGYFAAFVVVVVVTASVVFITRGDKGSRLALTGLTLTAVALLLLPLAWRPDLYVLRAEPAPRCESVRGTTVCVHPANATASSRVVAGVEQVNAVLGSPAAEQVTDTNASPWSEPRPGELLLSIGPGFTTSEMQVPLVQHAAGQDACHELRPLRDDEDPSPEWDVPFGLEAIVLERLGEEQLAGNARLLVRDASVMQTLSALSDEQLQRFVRDHRETLDTCSLDPGSIA